MKIDYLSDEEIKRTKRLLNCLLFLKKGGESTGMFLKIDILLLACVFEKFIKVSVHGFGNNSLFCVGLPGYTWQFGLNYTGINSQTLQDKNMILLLEKIYVVV